MFDLGFTEILLVGVVALLVFGPEELPRVARTVGHVLGRMRRYVADVKADINREMEQADLKQMYDDVQASAQELKASMDESLQVVERGLDLTQVESPKEPAVAEPAPELPLESPLAPVLSVSQQEADEKPVDAATQPDLFAAATPRKEA